jgi:hypothetical protein
MCVKTSPTITSRLVLFLATLIALSAGIGVGPKRAGAKPDPVAQRDSSKDLEAQIESLIQGWFAVLEDPNVDVKTLSGQLAEAPFELLLDGAVIHDRGALLAWTSSLRSTYPQIEYRLDPIHIHAEGGDRYRVRFEFDRHALDDAGLPHVVRREHTWIVQSSTSETPVILRIEERPLIFFPGTGPQVVCY